MKTRTSATIFGLLTLIFIGALVYEIWYIKIIRNTAAEALALAETKLGVDNWSRSIRSLQVEYKDRLLAIDEATLTRTGLIELVGLLESNGKKMGLTLAISSVKDDPKVKTDVRVVVNTLGAWEPTLRYVHLLENLPYKISVEDTNLNAENDKWRGVSTLRITLTPEST